MAKEEIGTVFVDAGIVMVGDPCYTLPDDGSTRTETARDWLKFVDATFATEGPKGVYKPLGDGIAVVVESGYGDGEYPVFVRRNDEGRVIAVEVLFDDVDD